MKFPRFQHARIVALSLAAALAAGCAQLPGTTDPTERANVEAGVSPDAPVVCILFNDQLKGDQYVQLQTALATGIRASGLNVQLLEKDDKPDECPLCMGYSIDVQNKAIAGIIFQIFEDGRPTLHANGPAENGQLQLQRAALYAKSLMDYYQKVKNDPNAAAAAAAPSSAPASGAGQMEAPAQ